MLSKLKRRRNRSGATAVEFAVIAPIFFLVILGGIEFASVHITQCAMENAAFEGARKGIVPGARAATCKASAEALMAGAGINEYTVTVTPATITAATDSVKVSVSVPMTVQNKFGLSGFLNDTTLVKAIELPRVDGG
jgi:Flp pilus assembly protein TadG